MADQQYYNVSGRLVQGDVFTPQTLDMKGRPMTDKNGNPKVQYFCAVAVAKDAPDLGTAYQGIQSVAMSSFRNGETNRPTFAWKIVDGDLPENAQKEGFPGHYVFRFTSGFPFRVVSKGAARPIVDQNEVKRGYYVRMFFTVAGNGDPQKPGVYLNGSIVELLGYGPEITAGPDAFALIAGAGQAYVPAGAMTTPIGGGGMPGQQYQPGPAPGGMSAGPAPGGMPGQQYQPGPAAGGMSGQPAPHYGILNPGQGR
jgi:hypothetical protein